MDQFRFDCKMLVTSWPNFIAKAPAKEVKLLRMKLDTFKVKSLGQYLQDSEVEILRVHLVTFVGDGMRSFVQMIGQLLSLKEIWLRSLGFNALTLELLLSLQELPLLVSVELDGISMTPANMSQYCSFLASKRQLKCLYYDGNGQTDQSLEQFYSQLSSMKELEVLQTWEFDGIYTSTLLSNCLSSLTQLTKLVLQYGNFDSASFDTVTRSFIHLFNLRELHLEYNEFGPEGAESLAQVLPELKHLEYLNLSGNNIQNLGFMKLTPALEQMNLLKALYLTYNSLTSIICEPAVRLFGTLPLLEELHLDENALIELDLEQLVLRCPSLRKLNLSKCQLPLSPSATHPASCNLQELQISKNGLNSFKLLLQLSKWPSLKSLNLSSNSLTVDVGIIDEIDRKPFLMTNSLECLDLSGTDLSVEGIECLAHFLGASFQFKELNFSDLGLASETLTLLIRAIQPQSFLEKLCLGNNFLEDNDANSISNAMSSLVHLRELDLNMNMISAQGAEHLCQVAATLTEFQLLNLVQNPIVKTSQRSLLEQFPNVLFESV